MLKIGKPIDISNCETLCEEFEGIFNKVWVRINGTDYLYKSNIASSKDYTELEYGLESSFCEVFNSYLAKKCDMDCVESCFAFFKENEIGCIVKSYIDKSTVEEFDCGEIYDMSNPDEDLILNSPCIDEILNALDFINSGIKVDPNIEEKLYLIALWDYFTMQIDRHTSNLAFLSKKDNNGEKYLTLAPIFDNGFSFFTGLSEKMIDSMYSDCITYKNQPIDKYLIYLSPRMHIRLGSKSSLLKYDLVTRIEKYESVKKLYNFFINLDLEKEFKEFTKLTSQVYNAKRQTLVILAFNVRKKELIEEYNNYKINEENNDNNIIL